MRALSDSVPAISESVSASTTAGRERSAFLDNAKAILVTLVVLGHVLGNIGLRSTPEGAAAYALIYAFHIPAFAFITGWLSRPDTFTRRGMQRFLRVFALYIAFQIAHVTVAHYLSPGLIPLRNAVVYPTYALWWLMSMLTWQLLLPPAAWLMSRTRPWIVIAATLCCALLVGVFVTDGNAYSLMRTLNFLPFYLAGYAGSTRGWRLPRPAWARLVSAGVFLTAYAMLLSRDANRIVRWLFSCLGVVELPTHLNTYLIVRTGLWGVSAVLIIAFLQLVPRRRTFFTHMGSTTLSVFVWHSLIIFTASQARVFHVFNRSWIWALVITAGLATVLGFGPVARLTSSVLASPRGKGEDSGGPSPTGIAWTIALVIAFLGTLGARTYVALPFESLPARVNPAAFAALFAGVAGAVMAWRSGVTRRGLRLGFAAFAFLVVDLLVYSADTIAGTNLEADPRTWILAVMGAAIMSQKTFASLGSLLSGIAVGGVDKRIADRVVGGIAAGGLVIAVMQMLYKAGYQWPGLLALKAFDTATNPVHSVWGRATGLDVSPNAFGGMAVVCIAIALATMRGSWLRPLTVLAGVGSILFSQSRGATIALGAVVIVYLALEGRAVLADKDRRRADGLILLCGVVVIAVALTLPGVATNLTRRMTAAVDRASDESASDSGIDGRLVYWRIAADVIARAPLGTHVTFSRILRGPLDNEYLSRALRAGPITLLAFLGMLWWLARLRPDGERALGPLLATAVATLAISMDPTGAPAFFSMTMFVAGSRVGHQAAQGVGGDEVPRAGRRRVLIATAAGVVLVATLIPLVWRPHVVTEAQAYDDRIQDVRAQVIDYREDLGEQVRLRSTEPVEAPDLDEAERFVEEVEPPVDRDVWRESLDTSIEECEAAAQDVAGGLWQDAAAHLAAADAADALFARRD